MYFKDSIKFKDIFKVIRNLTFYFFIFLISTNIPIRSKEKEKRITKDCEIIEKKIIPKKSSLIIGHAYPLKYDNQFIGTDLEDFLIKNKDKINTIFFTGDVFRIPNKSKWEKLYIKFFSLSNQKKIIIAPGNHDIGFGDNELRNIFLKSPFFINDFPFTIKDSGYQIIIEDSGSNNWLLSDKTYELLNRIESNIPVIILRHHIPVKELIPYANSQAGMSTKLPNLKELEDSFNRPIIIIAGDGGAFESQPRVICKEYGKIKLIVNGLAEIKEDKLIYIYKNNIYQYKIAN